MGLWVEGSGVRALGLRVQGLVLKGSWDLVIGVISNVTTVIMTS